MISTAGCNIIINLAKILLDNNNEGNAHWIDEDYCSPPVSMERKKVGQIRDIN